jgi:hypothetical protein
MVEMIRPAWASSLGSEFDAFLFAPVGADGHGALLSVLSALARLNLDPWQEAAKLSLLPRDVATRRLASLIAVLPDEASAPMDCPTIAARLIALLPRRAPFDIRSGKTLLGAQNRVRPVLFAMIVFLAYFLGSEWFSASHPSPQKVDNAHPAATGAGTPKTPPK